MPDLKVPQKPSTRPTAPKGKKGLPEPEREVVFPDIRVNGVLIPREKLRLDAKKAKELLGWQTELEYGEEQRRKDPKLKEDSAQCKFSDNDVLLTDISGARIRCVNNSNNRPFKKDWALELAQSILTQTYKFNGQGMTVSRTNVVTDGQHRSVAVVLATQMYNNDNAYWKQYWEEEPYIESFIFTGGSDDPEVIRTQDYGMPRSLSDVAYTSPYFHNFDKKSREECSRMLSKAIDLLWKRVGMGNWIPPGMESKKEGKEAASEDRAHRFHHYQTHSESMEFLSRHPRLSECVRFIFDANTADKGRPLSVQKISAGEAATVMYLMGFCESDRTKYMKGNPPSESQLKFDKKRWEQASSFWAKFIAKSPDMQPVHDAIKDLRDEEADKEGKRNEKFAIICRAWNLFKEGDKITKAQVRLNKEKDYAETKNGTYYLIDQDTRYNFGGVDIGEKGFTTGDKEDEETKAQIEARKNKARKEEANKILAARLAKGNKDNGPKGIMDYEPGGKKPPKLSKDEEELRNQLEDDEDDEEENEDEDDEELRNLDEDDLDK